MSGLYDPVATPESYNVGSPITTAEERARARLKLALATHDRDDLVTLLQALGLDNPAEIRAQLAHPERSAA